MPEAGTVMAPVAAGLDSFLALDFGTRRTGVAYASRLLGQARPLATVAEFGTRFNGQTALLIGLVLLITSSLRDARTARDAVVLTRGAVVHRGPASEVDPDAGAACIILDQFLRSIA